MRRHWLRLALLLTAAALAGCGRGVQVATPDVAPEDNDTKLGDTIDLDLAAALKLGRPELAKLADEWAETVKTQLTAVRENPESVDLLPKLLPPLTVPVFHEAKYSAAAGFSLPPYLDAGKKDAGVAAHLARFGDHEAASKVGAAPFGGGTNYPVEWTRLAGLALISSQLKLTLGDNDGATQIVLLHRQLADVLDKKAAEGPLGAVLLSAGKRALEAAAVAYREPKRNKKALADEIDAAVAAWGSVPAASPALAFDEAASGVSALFGSAARGKAVIADKPAAVARALDLCGLPLPREGVQVVVAFLDDKDRLAEWQLAYQAKVDTLYPTPGHVAFRLLEAGFAGKDETKTANLVRQDFVGGDVACEVVRTNRSVALGGHVRVFPAKGAKAAAATRGLRDFGKVSLDRGFEANRLAAAPGDAGALVTIKDGKTLQSLAAVLDTSAPDVLILNGDRPADVLNSLEMAWTPAENEHALARLLPSLWDDYGAAKLDDVEDQAGSYLAFTWQDKTTRSRLRLAYDERGPVLDVKDTQGPDKLQARTAEVRRRDEQERLARLEGGKPEERFARSPGQVNDFLLTRLQLGQPKAAAEAALPKGKAYRKKTAPGGTSVLILSNPEPTAAYWGRQILVRYERDKVAEIRVRFQMGPATAKKGESLLERLGDAKAGAPESPTPTWAGLWADLPDEGKIVYHRWSDDRTVRTYQQDAGGIEVVWLDRQAGSSGPWRFGSQGIPGCAIDDVRSAVESALKAPVSRSGVSEVYRMPAASPYEMAIVTYEKDRVSRILAVHRDRPGAKPPEVSEALSRAWGRNLDALGYIRRQEGAHGQVLGAYYWHDDRVRVQTSVKEDEQGPRLVSEWRTWPVQPDKTVALP